MNAQGVVTALAASALLAGGVSAADLDPYRLARTYAPGGEPAAAPLRLTLAWLDVTGCAIGLSGIAQAEATSVFARLGLEVEWRQASPSEAFRDEVRIILLDRLAIDPATGRPVLGATPDGKRTSPFVWVHVRSIQAGLGIRPGRPDHALSGVRRRELALALGRVVAHEVVHAVAAEVPHGHGVMSDLLNRRQLTAPRLSFDPGVGVAVRAALLGLPPPPRAQPGVLAAQGGTAPAR